MDRGSTIIPSAPEGLYGPPSLGFPDKPLTQRISRSASCILVATYPTFKDHALTVARVFKHIFSKHGTFVFIVIECLPLKRGGYWSTACLAGPNHGGPSTSTGLSLPTLWAPATSAAPPYIQAGSTNFGLLQFSKLAPRIVVVLNNQYARMDATGIFLPS